MSAPKKWLLFASLMAGFFLVVGPWLGQPDTDVPQAAARQASALPVAAPQATAPPSFKEALGPRGKWLALLFTGNVQGEVEPCG